MNKQAKQRIWAHLFSAFMVVAAVCHAPGWSPSGSAAEQESGANYRRPTHSAALKRWLVNMAVHHQFSNEEIAAATGLSETEITSALDRFQIDRHLPHDQPDSSLRVLPYPGGRHPRIGFRDGAVRPQRDTKLSVFTPWDPESYVVLDLPEAIWSNLGLTYLAHTHIPTIFDRQDIQLEKREWKTGPRGLLCSDRRLPNGIEFGTVVRPHDDHLQMEMWLTNGTEQTLTDLRVQNCAMLAYAKGFQQQTNVNKQFRGAYAICRDRQAKRWIITAWEPIHRPWGNPPCPCLHADPKFPDCPPGETVHLRGWFSFYAGSDINRELARIESTDWKSADYLIPDPHAYSYRMPTYPDKPAPPARPRAEVADLLADSQTHDRLDDNSEPIAIVLVAGPKDHQQGEHDYPAWQRVWTRLLSVHPMAEVDTAWEFPSSEQIRRADVLVFYQRGRWDRSRQVAIDRFLKRGGGLVYIHWAVDGRGGQAEMAQRIGLSALGGEIRFRHGPLEIDFSPGSGHPIARNFERIRWVDESYWQLTGDRDAIRLLGTSLEDGAARPQFWTTSPQAGRVFVSIPGHYMWTFDDPAYRTLLLRGILWSADRPVDLFNDLITLDARMQ